MRTLTNVAATEDIAGREAHPADHWQAHASFDSGRGLDSGQHVGGEHRALGLRTAVLVHAIQNEIIPRLMQAHRQPRTDVPLPALAAGQIGAQEVQELARLMLSQQHDVAHACVEAVRLRGIPVETICLDLLGPVARHLGELWQQDLCDFAEVTLGLGRLQQMLRELSPAFDEPSGRAGTLRRILLLPGPGDQHTFGLVMVAEFFRRAGWDVAGGGWEAGADPVVMVRQEWFDVVGFSLGAETHLGALCECIRSVRQAALNPQVGIMVGGPVFSQHPECAVLVEADAVATDGLQATELAERLVSSKQHPGQRGVRACQCHP